MDQISRAVVSVTALLLFACGESRPSDGTETGDAEPIVGESALAEMDDEEIYDEGPLDYLDLSEKALADFNLTLRETVSLFGLQIYMSKAEAFTKLGERGFAPTDEAYKNWSNGDVTLELEFDWLSNCERGTAERDPQLLGYVLTRASLNERNFQNFAVKPVGATDDPPHYPDALATIIEKDIGSSQRLGWEFEHRRARRMNPASAHAAWCTAEDPLCRRAQVFSDVDEDGDVTTVLLEMGGAGLETTGDGPFCAHSMKV